MHTNGVVFFTTREFLDSNLNLIFISSGFLWYRYFNLICVVKQYHNILKSVIVVNITSDLPLILKKLHYW